LTPSKADAKASGRASARAGAAPGKDKREISCKLSASEAPRGGQIKVTGRGFGSTPVVRIGPVTAKIIKRGKNKVTVQVSRVSNGGEVTLKAGGKTVKCGKLRIIGKN
jgi:hypothetical protein